MKAQLLLADSAQQDSAGAKVHALGIGWTATSTPTPPMALVVLIRVPWSETNRRHRLHIGLFDADGQPVLIGVDGEGNAAPLEVRNEFEVGRPPGVPDGFSLEHSLAINLPPGMPLAGDAVYEWRMTIDDEHDEDWTANFLVRR